MITNDIINSVKQTIIELESVEEELNRPLEDVVTLSACFNVRHSMMSLLNLYLQNHSITNQDAKSLEDLLTQCIQLDKQFADIDITRIECKEHHNAVCTSQYCLSTEKITDCLLVANQLKGLIIDKLNIKDFD